MFFGSKTQPNRPKRAEINLNPNHKFRGLAKFPDAQLMMLVPKAVWQRTRAYIPHYEAVHLAGRFGAEPGDYEWEVFDKPQGLKWWRRTVTGDAAYCAAIIVPFTDMDPVEALGIIDIASDSPWWFDGIFDMTKIRLRAEALTKRRNISMNQAEVQISIEEEYRAMHLITTERDSNGVAWRVGDIDEVTRLKDTIMGLFDRARGAVLPGEVQTGTLKRR